MSEKQKNDKKSGFFLKYKRGSIGDAYERSLEKDDPIYKEPIHALEPPSEEKKLIRGGIDVYFLIIVLAISLIGVVMAYSASSFDGQKYMGDSLYYVKRHVIFLLIGIGFAAPFVILARPWFWRLFAIIAYAASIPLLLAVLVIGSTGGGAQRWIAIGPLTIQPSELAKMAVVMFLALRMSKYEKKIELSQRFKGHFRYGVLYPVLVIASICGLVMLEKHLSGLIIIGLLGLTIMFIGGTQKKWMFLIIGAGLVAVLLVLLVSDYAMERVNTWLFLEKADPRGSAWQTWQGLYAIGSGGFFGVGLGNSRQKYGYLPVTQNDFIFSVICEELGFIGAIVVILLFIVFLFRGFYIASAAPDKFGMLLCSGIVIHLTVQAFLNIAVVTNAMPNTGVSLPFISYGGTALVMQMAEMGIVLNISRKAAMD